MRRRSIIALSAVVVAVARIALAQQVLDGDPVDPGSGLAYPIMPGLPLVLPGADEDFGTGDDVVDTGLSGDVDLVVRSGDIAGPSIPAPSLAGGGPAIATVTAGGGSTGQGGEAPFTILVSDGTGAYGTLLADADMDLRPATVYAFADLDGDGTVGPTGADGSSDDPFELQEATAYAGRQMGTIFEGRFQDSLGIEIAAPASIGGLTVALVAGAWTGTNPEELFTDGPFILTHWPFFPPLDPARLLGGGNAPSPDPGLPNQLEWDIERNYLPATSHPTLGNLFAVAVDGSEPTTDQVIVQSAPATSVRVFAETAASNFLARSRPRLRVAPAVAASGRVAVLPVERVVLAADGVASQLVLRVLPVDLFANVADPAAAIGATLTISGAASIVSPDTDADPKTEPVMLSDAEGVQIVLDDDGIGVAELRALLGGNPVASVAVAVGSGADSDGDGIPDDGNSSSVSGDRPCDDGLVSCDDNCPRVINPGQFDDDHDGLGNCCDGTCEDDPQRDGCDECALPAGPSNGTLSGASVKLRSGGGVKPDKLTVKLEFELPAGAAVAPDVETVMLSLMQSGSSGYLATLASVLADRMKAKPSYLYVDRNGAIDSVVKARLKGDGVGGWKMQLRAKGLGAVELASGTASLELAIGDDVVTAPLACTGTALRVQCNPVP